LDTASTSRGKKHDPDRNLGLSHPGAFIGINLARLPLNQLLAANNFQIVRHPAQRTHSPFDLTAFWRVYLYD